MAKPELGTKRLCANCGAKFYDLSKNPIVCPKCSTVFQVVVPAPRTRPDTARPAVAEEAAAPEPMEAEFVSLEEADAESQGGKGTAAGGPEAEDEDIELDESLDDAAFIEETEEGEEDVTDIIGDVEDEEET